MWVRGGLGIEESLVAIVLAPLFFFPRRLFNGGGERWKRLNGSFSAATLSKPAVSRR